MIFSTFLIGKKLHSPGIRRAKVERQMASLFTERESLTQPILESGPSSNHSTGQGSGLRARPGGSAHSEQTSSCSTAVCWHLQAEEGYLAGCVRSLPISN